MRTTDENAAEAAPYARQAKWRAANPVARWAHIATASAVRRGIIQTAPCRDCGAEKAEAHHPDHRDPLNVVWLCRLHHRAEHRRLKCEAAG